VNSVAKMLKSSHGRIAVLATSVVVVAVAASAAWAAIPDAEGTIHACADHEGRLRVIDTDAGKTCKASETRLSWAATGPPPPPPPEPEAKPPRPAEPQLPDAFVALRTAAGPRVPSTGASTEVLDLELPAGKYLVTAKLVLGSQGTALHDPVRVFCALGPGSPVDDSSGIHLAPVGSPGEMQVITLLASAELADNGSMKLSCSADGNEQGALASNTVLRAIEVGSITTDPGVPPLP
jgi:hypothetical protein